jgi:undecaprenyl diphosphate synthase
MTEPNQIDKTNIPKHIAVIMDGNGRWAKLHGQNRLYGHGFGVDSVRDTLKAAVELGIEYLTLYAFSTENWNRPKDEVDGLMKLLVQSISNEVDELLKMGVKLSTIGDIQGLPQECIDGLGSACDITKDNTKINLVLALNYSARWDIKNAISIIADNVVNGLISAEDITDELISANLSTHSIPDPELLIRTSGENRISNFLLWEIAYTELYFTEILWPDFRAKDLFEAVKNYQSRERRFGMVSEQLIPLKKC